MAALSECGESPRKIGTGFRKMCAHRAARGAYPSPMKPDLSAFLLTLTLTLSMVGFGLAESGGKEITLTGKACCAKCALKKADACQTVLSVDKDGKKTLYWIADNDVAKSFHDNVCKGAKPVTVTATCKKVGDKLELTCSKMDLAK
jgi:hypothetical protein